MPLFINDDFREKALAHVTDELVLAFWAKEFKSLKYKNTSDGVAPIANKIGGFLANPLVRKAVCDPDEPLRLRKIMDEGRILVVNLGKGKLGADVSNVLGGLLISSLAHAAYSRQDISNQERNPYFLYVDEFHSFTTDAFAELLSELRKYKLGLVLAHQHTTQLSSQILESILGNVGSMFLFRLGATDARIFSRQLVDVEYNDLVSLENYKTLARIMNNGKHTPSFTAKT